MDTIAKELLFSIRQQQDMMIEQLHQFCAINSGSTNPTGLASMRDALINVFQPLADDYAVKPSVPITILTMSGEQQLQTYGDSLIFRKRPELTRRILLTGHMDTVYGQDHRFQTLTYLDDNRVNGPGVADMKGGLIVMLQALLAFEQTPLAKTIGWDVLINADEELGSPASSRLFQDLAASANVALIYEPAMDTYGTLAKHRCGSGKLTIIAHGRAAHAGRAFHEGRNAICYLAEMVLAIHALNGTRPGVTINVGKIAGGEALNVVPDKAVAKLDIRIKQAEDEQWVVSQLDHIRQRLQRSDYSLTIHGNFSRPVKHVSSSTERLFRRIQTLAAQIDVPLDWQDSGGCCDGNNFSALGLPVIDTLGVRGGNIHSSDEFILLDSLVERASLSTLLLLDLAQGGLEELTL